MNQILHVTSNLKLGNDFLAKGSFIEMEIATIENLIKDGTLRIVEGAKDLAHAAEIVATEEAKKLADEVAAGVKAETPNTWGPAKEPVVAPEPETAPEASAEATGAPTEGGEQKPSTEGTTEPTMAKFEVLKEFEVTNPDSKNFGKHLIGDVVEADATAALSLVEDGTLAPIAPETGDNL